MVHVPESVHRLAREIEGWLELGCPERALAKMDGLLANPGARPAALQLRIRSFIDLCRFEDAIADIVEIRSFDHEPDLADLNEAWCRKRIDDLEGAADCMRRMIQRNHRSPIGHFNLGCYLALLGDTRQALDEVTKACGLDVYFRTLLIDEDDLSSLRGIPEFQRLAKQPPGSSRPHGG